MADDRGVAEPQPHLQTAERPRRGQQQRRQQAAAKPVAARVGLVAGTSLNSPAAVADVLLRLKRIGVVGSTAFSFAETCDVAQVHAMSDRMLVALVGGTLPTLPEFPGEGVPLGLPGALSPTRWVGGTTGGAPTTGKFKTGDWIAAPDGIWYCSSGDGTSLGTWQNTSTLSSSPDASTSQKGILKLAGDLAGTALLPTVPGLAGKAPLASPALTGTPTAPTAAPGTNTTQLATAAFVQTAVTALLNGAPGALDTLKELADALGDDASFATTMTNLLALKAPLASPVFTGNPTAPTPAGGDNDTSVATTAFVTTAVAGSAPTPTAVKTSAYTAAAGDLVPVDTTSGAVTVTLPAAPADKTRVVVKHVIQGGTNAVTVACGGSDVLNKAGGPTSGALSLLNQAIGLQYAAASGIWYVVSDDLSLSQLDLRFMKLPASPSDGQLAAWNNSTGLWVPTNPSGTSELAYAENVTGTVTTVAANAAATDIPSTTLVVAASTRPVYLSAGFTFLLTGTATAGAYIGIKIVEVSNGTDTPLSWQANVPVPAATINVSGTPQIAGVRLAASTARTRTFKVQTANVGAGHSVNNANAAADFKTWIAAEAR